MLISAAIVYENNAANPFEALSTPAMLRCAVVDREQCHTSTVALSLLQ